MGCPTSSRTRCGWGFTPANRSTALQGHSCCLRITSGVTWGRRAASGRHHWVGRLGSCRLPNGTNCSVGLVLGESFRVIAERLGRSHSTVSREVARNGGRQSYRAHAADQAAYGRGRRPKPSKLATSARLRAEVEKNLDLDWSPEQISLRLPLDYPTDHAMRISHETIYLELFLPSRKALHARLIRHLRTGRLMRHANQAKASTAPPRIKNMTLIADRPFAADDRTKPGNWEGDLVMGRRPSAVATLVERSSRYVRLVALPARHQGHPSQDRTGRRPQSDRSRNVQDAHLGPRPGDGGPRHADRGDRLPGVLLRCPQPLAAGHE